MSTLKVKGISAPTGYDLQMPAGAILQVVRGTTSSNVDVSSNSPQDLGLSATITPKFSNSKIYITCNVSALISAYQGSDRGFALYIYRGSTQVLVPDGNYGDGYFYQNINSTTCQIITRVSQDYIDSPSTTSATTYKIYASTHHGRTVGVCAGNSINTITLMEVAG